MYVLSILDIERYLRNKIYRIFVKIPVIFVSRIQRLIGDDYAVIRKW